MTKRQLSSKKMKWMSAIIGNRKVFNKEKNLYCVDSYKRPRHEKCETNLKYIQLRKLTT